MVRYKLDKDVRYIWLTVDRESSAKLKWRDKFKINNNGAIFVDIIEHGTDAFYIKVYLQNGDVIVGFLPESISPIVIHSYDELFDGRFNS